MSLASSPDTVRVGIVEDDSLLGAALVAQLTAAPGYEVVGWAESFGDGCALLNEDLDVFLVDLGLPDGPGLDLITLAHQRDALKILVLSVFGDVRHVVQAIERGADGYILKGAESMEIETAITTVRNGGAPISPAVAGHILARVRGNTPSVGREAKQINLTPREINILEHLSKGLSFKEVASIESISYYTVADHVKTIYRKLAVNSRSEAVFEAVQAGLIRLKE